MASSSARHDIDTRPVAEPLCSSPAYDHREPEAMCPACAFRDRCGLPLDDEPAETPGDRDRYDDDEPEPACSYSRNPAHAMALCPVCELDICPWGSDPGEPNDIARLTEAHDMLGTVAEDWTHAAETAEPDAVMVAAIARAALSALGALLTALGEVV